MKPSALFACGILFGAKLFGASLAGVVEIAPAEHWKSDAPDQASPFPTLKISPTDGRNADLLITLLPNELVKISDDASLRALHQRLCSPMVGPSGKSAEVTEIKIQNGTGLYSVFEDPTLVGKPPKRGDYKIAIPMVVWLRPDIVLQITLFTDNATGPDLIEALKMIQRAKAVGHPAPVSSETMVMLGRKPIEIRGPDAVLVIPMSTFKPTGTGDKGRNYFAFIDDKRINLSGWMDQASRYSGFRAFWDHEKAAMEKGTGLKTADEEMKIIAGWNAVTYTIKLGDLEQRNLRACRVTGNTWADLHLSVVASDGTNADLETVLKTILLKRDS